MLASLLLSALVGAPGDPPFDSSSDVDSIPVLDAGAKPANPKAGRVVEVVEEWRIDNARPEMNGVAIASLTPSLSGDLLVVETRQGVLLYDAAGQFVRDLLRLGHKPGELQVVSTVLATSTHVALLGAGQANDLVVIDREGTLVYAARSPGFPVKRQLVWADAAGVLLTRDRTPTRDEGEGIRPFRHDLIEVVAGAPGENVLATFSTLVDVFFTPKVTSIGYSPLNELRLATADGKTIFVSESPEYLVEVFSRDRGAVVSRFKRTYSRVRRAGRSSGGVAVLKSKGPGEKPEVIERRDPLGKPVEYYADIVALTMVDGRLWVQTSTVQSKKGILFDVFDAEGHYLDNFYLKVPKEPGSEWTRKEPLTLANGHLYVKQGQGRGKPVLIIKYRLVGL